MAETVKAFPTDLPVDVVDAVDLAAALVPYAKLDGTNQRFTDDIGVDGGTNASVSTNSVPAAIGGNDAYTVLLLKMDTVGTVFTDSSSSAKAMTTVGGASQVATKSKFGGVSGYFDGAGDYLTTPNSTDWAFGTGDWTIDYWAWMTDFTQQLRIISKKDTATPFFYHRVSGAIYMDYTGGNPVNIADLTAGQFPSNSNWHHFAYVKYGSTVTRYVDGVAIGSCTGVTGSMTTSTNILTLFASSVGTAGFSGYIDEFRISKGIARWTADFTPPTQEYDTGTSTKGYPQFVLEKNGTQTAKFWTDGNASDAIKIDDATGTRVTIAQTTGNVTLAGSVQATDATLTNLTASQILSTDANKKLTSLAVATYPSLAELAYVKGVTSAVQTQLDARLKLDQATPQEIINGYPINASEPEFTYTAGVLTRVDYPSGFYKVLAYNVDGTLNTITYSNGTVKTMNWDAGLLESIGVA
jgi:hypothetical protein